MVTAASYEVRALGGQQEEVRNKRQMSTTAFESFDQKANQLFQMLSAALGILPSATLKLSAARR